MSGGGEGVVHVVGAGLAGLAAALEATRLGARVALHEGAGAAGGRCRSLHDARLGREIDNGNHLVLTGNDAARAYLRETGAEDALVAAPSADFPFVDLSDGRRWTVSMGRGRSPLWLLDPERRPPGLRLGDLRDVAALARAGEGATVAEAVRGRGGAWARFWVPMTLAVMNAAPERASARLFRAALAGSVLKGGAASRPMFAPRGLGAAFVAPALATLKARGVAARFHRPLRAARREDGRLAALVFDGEEIALRPEDRVVLALPPARLKAVAPWLDPPGERGAILNAHFLLPEREAAAAPRFLGVLGAETQWIFRRGEVVSVTVSSAEDSVLFAQPPEPVADALWAETRRALELSEGLRPLAARVLKEKRATFDQSPESVAKRLAPQALANLVLAGDHVRTGLPATIEGAIRSGRAAGRLAATPRSSSGR